MTENSVKKPIACQALESLILDRLKVMPHCGDVQTVRVGRLERPALSNWTIKERDLGGNDASTCVRALAQIMTDLQAEYFLETTDAGHAERSNKA
jgi:hypothetical protein